MKEILSKKVLNTVGFLFLAVLIVFLVYDLSRKGIFSSRMGINVAVIGNNSVALMLLRPDEELISWVQLPSNLKVKIFNSSASYPILSLWGYAHSEKKPFAVFEKSLGMTLGVAVSRIVKINGEATVENVLGSIHKPSLITDLSIRDRWLIRQFVSDSVESKKMIEEIVPGNAFNEITEPDGKKFLVISSIARLWTNSKFILEPILSENVDVVINNLTGQSGYGTDVSKQVESAGMRVIEVKADTSDSVEGTGCLFATTQKVPVSEQFLVEHLSCHKISPKEGSEKGISVWLK